MHPITLADVLRAIADEPGKFNMWLDAWTFEDAGPHLLIQIKGDDSDEGIVSWNLTLPLDDQDPEVIIFLEKVLCGSSS